VIRGLTVLASTFREADRPVRREELAGVDSLVVRPPAGHGPVVVFANAATPRGVEEPFVARFLGALADAGFVAVAPELPHVRDGEVTPRTVEALVSVSRSAGTRVGLVGISTGAGLVLLAAADPRLANRVTAVVAIAPFASLERILRLGTTGHYDERPFDAAPLVRRAAIRSLAASAPEDPAVPALLANSDPELFDALYADLLPSTRALVNDLSPLTHIARVLAPVELVTDPEDRFFPAEESRALARAGTDVRLTVTRGLEHVRPRRRPGVVRVVGALDRTLERTLVAPPLPTFRPLPVS
jgi:dienelactone hydrolase